MHLCAGFMRHLALEAVWIEHCRCALFTVFYELHLERILQDQSSFFLTPWHSSRFYSQLVELSDLVQLIFFFFSKRKTTELLWFALAFRFIWLGRKCLIRNQSNRCSLLDFCTAHTPASACHKPAIGAALGHPPAFLMLLSFGNTWILVKQDVVFSLQALCMFFPQSAVHLRQAVS